MTEPVTDAGERNADTVGAASILLNFFEAHNVGHVIEALHYCLGHHRANPDMRLSVLLNALAPTELAQLCPFVQTVYPVELPGYPEDTSGTLPGRLPGCATRCAREMGLRPGQPPPDCEASSGGRSRVCPLLRGLRSHLPRQDGPHHDRFQSSRLRSAGASAIGTASREPFAREGHLALRQTTHRGPAWRKLREVAVSFSLLLGDHPYSSGAPLP